MLYHDVIPKPDYTMLTMLMSIGEQFNIFIKRIAAEKQRDSLEAELNLNIIELKQQAVILRQSVQAKSTFLANMSHELRTPLNSIIGFSELVFKELEGPLCIAQKSSLKEVVINSHHLLHLIDDILDLTKLEALNMELHPVETLLSQVVDEVRHAMMLSMNDKNISFLMAIDPTLTAKVLIDSEKLKQILFNYLSNAIKFTQDGGRIEVQLSRENPDSFRIAVKDTGIGIHKKDIKKLFVMFEQLNISYSKSYQGMGLGLALTRHITKMMGGHVGVDSRPGQGSTFFVVLPLVYASH